MHLNCPITATQNYTSKQVTTFRLTYNGASILQSVFWSNAWMTYVITMVILNYYNGTSKTLVIITSCHVQNILYVWYQKTNLFRNQPHTLTWLHYMNRSVNIKSFYIYFFLNNFIYPCFFKEFTLKWSCVLVSPCLDNHWVLALHLDSIQFILSS